MNIKFDVNDFKKYLLKLYKNKKSREYIILGLIIILIIVFILKDKLTNNNPIPISTDVNTDVIVDEPVVISIYVDISGEVNIPGVYKVTTTTRLFEVIEMAGGLTENANIDAINQAELVYDGQKIIVERLYENDNTNYQSGTKTGKISINKANLEELKKLPGIGDTKAQRIIDYRTQNGKFKTIEELKNVSGIGDTTYESLKDLICL